MTTQIIEIGRHRYLCGLFWQSLSRRHELRAEAVELAKRLNFDAMVLRVDRGFAGAGFASTREGAPLGLPSLGALVSKTIAAEGAFYDGRQQPAPNWLGAFSLPDGRWAYFAVRDGAFLPNGDWIGTSEEVFERLHSDYSLGGWNVVIGDPRVEVQGFHNFYPRVLEDVLPRRAGKTHVPRWTRLVPVSSRTRWRRVAVLAALLTVAGALGVGAYAWWQQRADAARERAFALARIQLLAHPLRPAPPPEPPHPWASEPLPAVLVRHCLDQFIALAPGGWQLDDYVCRAGNVSYRWSRNDSTVAMLMAIEPRAVVDNSGEHATLVEPAVLPAGGDDRLEGVRGVRLRVLSGFQLLGVALTLSLQSLPAPQGDAGKQDPRPSWQTWRMSANLGELSPQSVLSWLDQPGLRLDKLSYQAGQWSVEGAIYEK
jgi:hypothetical protein